MNTPIETPRTPRKKKKPIPDTPRKRKSPVGEALYGLRNLGETVESVGRLVSMRLRLTFDMDEWQTHVIHRIRQGYDSIVIAGTGYGKSLIFQGLAVLEPKKILIIISPLKALERDQVSEAEAKGLKAVMINENTVSSDLWSRLRLGKDNLYYVSPEMALGGTFLSLWQDVSFRHRVQAIIVDEAHCIAEWGDEFRKEYSGLSRLRDYVGQAVPVVACTATCSTKTFDLLWTSLKFGYRPFWGLDAGCDRANLTYLIRPLQNTKNPVVDVLNILPANIPPDMDPTLIPKCILYFETLAECNKAMETLRKVLPASLRQTVQTFVGLTSEAGKEKTWENFKNGTIRILCATDAAGMGCNVPDIKFVALFCVPRSMSVLAQRWGRAGRDRSILGTCFLFAQSWAFRPKGEPRVTASGKAKPLETKASKSHREKLEPDLEKVINLGFDSVTQDCVHRFLRSHFRPETDLHTFKSLSAQVYDQPYRKGVRSLKSNFQLSWTQLSLNREAPSNRCCNFCISALLTDFMPPCGDDPRLSAYANDFLFPLHVTQTEENPTIPAAVMPQRPHSHSVSSNSSTTSSNDNQAGGAIAIPMSHAKFVPLKHKFSLPDSEYIRLKNLLETWRDDHRLAERGEFSLLSSKVDLPDSALRKILSHGGDFLRMVDITPVYLKKLVQLDLASVSDLRDISNLILEWREGAALATTPGKGPRRPKKMQKKSAPGPLQVQVADDKDITPRPSRRPSISIPPQPVFEQVPPNVVEDQSSPSPSSTGANDDVFNSNSNKQAPVPPVATQSVPDTNRPPQPPPFVYYPPMIHPHLAYFPYHSAYHAVPPGYPQMYPQLYAAPGAHPTPAYPTFAHPTPVTTPNTAQGHVATGMEYHHHGQPPHYYLPRR